MIISCFDGERHMCSILLQSNMFNAIISSQTEEWSFGMGGRVVQVNYNENTMHSCHWQWSLRAGSLLEQVVIWAGLTAPSFDSKYMKTYGSYWLHNDSMLSFLFSVNKKTMLWSYDLLWGWKFHTGGVWDEYANFQALLLGYWPLTFWNVCSYMVNGEIMIGFNHEWHEINSWKGERTMLNKCLLYWRWSKFGTAFTFNL